MQITKFHKAETHVHLFYNLVKLQEQIILFFFYFSVDMLIWLENMLVDHPIYSIQKKNNDGSEQYRLYEIPAFNTRGTTLKEVKESVYKLSHLMTAVTVKVKVRRAVRAENSWFFC